MPPSCFLGCLFTMSYRTDGNCGFSRIANSVGAMFNFVVCSLCILLLKLLCAVKLLALGRPSTRLTRRAGLRRSRPWYKLKRDAGPSPGLAENNRTFSEKYKKGSQTGSGWITPFMVISQFFREFPGFLKIQVEMPRAGKGGGAGAYPHS